MSVSKLIGYLCICLEVCLLLCVRFDEGPLQLCPSYTYSHTRSSQGVYVGSDIHKCEPHAVTGIHLGDTGAQLHWFGCISCDIV